MTEAGPKQRGEAQGRAEDRAQGRSRPPGAIATLVTLCVPFLLVLQATRFPGSVELAHYLPLHSFFEIFAIAVATLIFAIGWHAHTDETPPALLVLSTAFLGVALLDFGHLLSYAGMPDFVTPSGPEKAIAFWLAARLMAALALLMAAVLPWRKGSATLRYPLIGGVLLATAAVFWVVLWHPDLMPRTYVAGDGLTSLKVAAEYVLVLLYAGAALIFHRRRRGAHALDVRRLVIAAIAIAISELCFTLYLSVYDLANVAGHVYKVIGYWYLYRAVFVTAVHHPYDALHRSQRDLWREKEQARVTLLSIGDGLIATDTAGRVTLMNPVAERLTGWTVSESAGRPVAEVFDIENAETGERVPVPVQQVLENGEMVGLANHTVLVARGGTRSHIADMASPIRDRDGALHGVVMVFQDVTETYAGREALKDSLSLNTGILESAACGIIATTLDGVVRVFNREAERIFGYRSAEMVGTTDLPRLYDQDELRAHAKGLAMELDRPVQPDFAALVTRTRCSGRPEPSEWTGLRKDGARISVSTVTSVLRDSGGAVRGYLTVVMDVTERKRAEREIEKLAYYDPLTNLPNRRLLLEHLDVHLRAARQGGRCGALMFLDLDDFKGLNDARGHIVGDTLLRELAARLTATLRKGDLVSRLSGDEFVILLPDLGATREEATAIAWRVAEKLRLAVTQPFQLDRCEHSIFASIGLTVFPKTPDESVEDLLKQADTAMYAAKDGGRNTVRDYDPAMLIDAQARLLLQQDLRKAVDAGEFTLFLQPQTRADGTLVAAEALIRWQHPQRGFVAPGAFIAVAEDSGLILPLGDWVLMEACHVLRRLADAGSDCHLSVNISPRQFRQQTFCAGVIAALRTTRTDPGRLTLEITEGIAVGDCADTVAKMSELAAFGISFSLDDFGTGFSSLSYLTRLPVGEIKIDRSFVQDVDRNSHNAVLVETMLSIASRLGLKAVAEGVETVAERDFLEDRGCTIFQGYYFDRPMPVEDFITKYAKEPAHA
ncbi:diguanylate cyclase (GGDEF)-like protein/PAS domain S-box-containing protein [Azospirillum lipoferum]|uniref:EAL domain-containing protein n=1 Tax=Azospirillum lipoferum TaxID=193 RepID=A0A5A9G363_AZOLI|nr:MULTISPECIES: MASE3 domain-containing protein [Azospirillum]KAA0589020.1 EAL domain-containing protein [Azospirillum lipoferum]MCP1612388.1 diguanylate cyclase (GGDEF)-like protein/PAS domain S-box-containing protein [Azospirillum lipoferum]MDW5531828.1 MASE3 domain-containing protein [Azospirillum sp. NL1]